jgi:hypothetical protein
VSEPEEKKDEKKDKVVKKSVAVSNSKASKEKPK